MPRQRCCRGMYKIVAHLHFYLLIECKCNFIDFVFCVEKSLVKWALAMMLESRSPGSLYWLVKEMLSNLWYKVHQIPKLKYLSCRPAVVFVQCIEARCWVKNEDVVGAASTGDAPTTSEWSTILLPTKVCLILDVWQCVSVLLVIHVW